METEPPHKFDHDVVIVGGPAGCSAGVFCAREGLDTVIFDRGNSSLRRCAHLENYLGFPAGIDIEAFYALMRDHVETAGCETVSDLVESIDRTDDGEGFRVTPQEGEPVTARRVVAATRYDGEYLRGLDAGFVELEMTAKQLYPERFGEWPGYGENDSYPYFPEDEQLFGHGRVADIVNGEFRA